MDMIKLIPTPRKYEIIDEEYHKIELSLTCEVEEWFSLADAFSDSIEKIFEQRPSTGKGITFRFDASLASDEYTLDSKDNIVICASALEGASYGAASAIQLMKNAKEGCAKVQSVVISDKPEKEYRSFMLSTGRIFHPFSKMLKYIDICFFYKIKYFHMHIADKGLYTLPSKAFPLLPSKGKHYTYEEIEALNAYAAARGVVLLPEIECPGHASPLVVAYPEIFGNKFGEGMGVFYNELGERSDTNALICAGSEAAFEGIKKLINEVAEMFPNSPYIHMGGDEAHHEWWAECPDCRKYMKDNGIADTYELYSEYVGRVAEYILSCGKTPMVWEGFSQAGADRIPKETVVIAWESHYNLAPDLLASGFKIINATWQPLYIVDSPERRWTPYDILSWNVYNWQHWWPHSPARINPIHLAPTPDVLGATLCAWSMRHEQLISRLLELAPAFAEKTWNIERSYDNETYNKIKVAIENKCASLICD